MESFIILVVLLLLGGAISFALVSKIVSQTGLKVPEDKVFDRRL